MMMSPKVAAATLTDLAGACTIPVSFGELLPRSGQFVRHDYVLVGDVPVRAFKARGRWVYDERDVRRAGQALSEFAAGPSDLIEVDFPNLGGLRDLPAGERGEFSEHRSWRPALSAWIVDSARQVRRARRAEVDAYADAEWVCRYAVGNNGLPAGVSMEDFLTHFGDCTIACTQPVRLLVRDGGRWLLPRAYVALLDRWQALETDLAERARRCSRCTRVRPPRAYPTWRTATVAGYVTLCPDCTRAAYLAYPGHLRGAAYTSLRPSQRADEYLCRLCQSSRAMVWDHCHDHGLIRGPLCASCNTFEGHARLFLEHDGAILHLLECSTCRAQRTLSARFHLQIAIEHLEATQRHARCRRQPWIEDHRVEGGVHSFTLVCDRHGNRARWTTQVSPPVLADLIGAFVDRSIAGPTASAPLSI